MTITPGTRVGTYEIKSQLGEGGMGVVFLAQDTTLKRDVAIKVLPETFAADPDRVARFQREAQALAALNHPNIAAIHHVEECGAERLLVLEFVQGETLADRIRRGALPIDEAVALATQICLGLEAAHEKGITHRDLKPANIQVTPEGRVKLLDFGLARAMETDSSAAELSNSPTLVSRSFGGVILGTAAYMSPEQAKGGVADHRSDVWAFGCVLYEMLTGERFIKGETVSEAIASVLRDEVRREKLPPGTPPRVVNLIERCLRKPKAQRVQHIGDARIALEEAFEADDRAQSTPTRRSSRSTHVVWALLGVLTFLAGLAIATIALRRPAPAGNAVRFSTSPRPEMNPDTPGAPPFLSPDGKWIAYAAGSTGGQTLAIHELSSQTTKTLAGTEGMRGFFWSPDSRFVGFVLGTKLKKASIDGGTPQSIADLGNFNLGRGGGATWAGDGTILIGTGESGSILRISAAGGAPSPLLTRSNGSRYLQPRFFPDGRHFMFRTINETQPSLNGIYVSAIDGSNVRRIASGDILNPQYVDPGFLLFVRDGMLLRQQFSLERFELSGEPAIVADGINFNPDSGQASFSASNNGVLVFRSGDGAGNILQLTWLDRDGKQIAKLGDPQPMRQPALSPDGKLVVYERGDPGVGTRDLWMTDATGLSQRLTFDPAQEMDPVWFPDGNTIAFTSTRKTKKAIYRKTVSGSEPEQVLVESSELNLVPEDISSDGKYLVYDAVASVGGIQDIYLLELATMKSTLAYKSAFQKDEPHFSPDGKWLAFSTTESGKTEIYVTSVPLLDKKIAVSSGGGMQPLWSADGKELFYLTADGKLASVVFKSGAVPEIVERRTLFTTGITSVFGVNQYAVASDGKRFLFALPVTSDEPTNPITVIVNWPSLLNK